jgi:hypothetical protein
VNLRDTDLRGADLGAADLSATNLRDADLSTANLRDVDLRGADLRGANLNEVNLSSADLRGADLRHANLSWADLSWAKLIATDLRGADLGNANLNATMLGDADLSRAHLRWANLRDTDLSGANLSGADFLRAYLNRVELSGADFNNSKLGYTTLADIDLSTVKQLEAVMHFGPSTIGIDTIYTSKGKIPEVFMRGAGIPAEFITYMRSLVANPIEFYSCFISYSSNDQQFAEHLYGDLQSNNVRCWFAPHDVRGGRKLHEQIDQAIRVHEKVLLILSSHSMSSEWVKTEIIKARKREVRENKQVLFPVRLVSFGAIRDWECFDADTGKDSAREIREYFIPDFSDWKNHDSYDAAFERLLKDLKAAPTNNSTVGKLKGAR